MTRTGSCSGLLMLLVVCLSVGCAAVPRGEYRAGAFLHRDPTYSFRIPDGWRQAGPEDVDSIGYFRFQMKLVAEERRAQLRREEQRAMSNFDSFLLSSRGAVIMTMNGPNRGGVRLPARGVLTAKEQDALLSAVTKELESSLKKENATIESVELVEYGPLPAALIKARKDALLTVRALLFTGSSAVVVMHVGIPEEDDEGLSGFEELAKSFRFE